MADIEVVLLFTPDTLESSGQWVTLGRTRSAVALRVVRDALLAEAAEGAARWRDVDPALGALRQLEAERVTKLLALLLPDEELEPQLDVVPGRRGQP